MPSAVRALEAPIPHELDGVEQAHHRIAHFYYFSGNLYQPESLGQLAGTSLVVSGCTTHQQDAPGRGGIAVTAIRFE